MNYKIDYLDFGDGRPLMHFAIEENQVLDTFFATDVLQFSDLLVRTIDKVLKDKSSIEDCSFNQCSVRIEKDKTVIEDVYADDQKALLYTSRRRLLARFRQKNFLS